MRQYCFSLIKLTAGIISHVGHESLRRASTLFSLVIRPSFESEFFDVCVLPFCCLELHRRYDCEQVEQKDYEALVTLAKVISWPDHICE